MPRWELSGWDISSWVSLDWLVQTGLAVTLLIGLVLLVRRPFARMFGASAAYALWLLPVLRLFLPNMTIPRIFPDFMSKSSPETASILPPPEMVFLTPDMLEVAAKPSSMIPVLPFVFGVWVVGAGAFFLYHWLRQAAFMDKLLYNSEPAQGLQRQIESAAEIAGLKRIPQVKIADDNSGPLVSGFLNPVVILPSDFTEDFSAEQRHYALLHEFMHIKRGDLFVAAAWLAFRSLNWPNPLAHYAGSHFRSDQEAACDASVLKAMGGGPKTLSGYAETLVHAAKAATEKANLNGRASLQPSHLALTIHHPLKERLMILGTHKKASTWRSRTAAAVMIIGAAALTAPLTQATSHPDEELAGKVVKKDNRHRGISVIKSKTIEDGKEVSKHYEINIDGDKVEAFEIDNAGRKSSIDPSQIEGFDLDAIKDAKSYSFALGKDHKLKFMSKDDFAHWKDNEFKEWKEGDLKRWIEKRHDGELKIFSKDGETRFGFPNPPEPPHPPRLSKHSEHVFFFDGDEVQGLESLKNLEKLKGLKSLKSLKGLEGLKELEAELEGLDGSKTFTFFADDDDKLKLKMRLTESKLAAARSLLEDTEIKDGDSREIAKAKRELEKARKALKAAERALKDAN